MRKKDSKEVDRQSRLNKSNKARLLTKSKKYAAKEDYTPSPHHFPENIPVLPQLVARASDRCASSTGIRTATIHSRYFSTESPSLLHRTHSPSPGRSPRSHSTIFSAQVTRPEVSMRTLI
jgi:hypothetical protein